MRFTTITGKAKKYVEDNFPDDLYLDATLDENILYLQRGEYFYHVPTILGELNAYLRRYVEQDVIDSNLATWTWEDVFNSKSAKELLNPPSIPIIKIEPTSPVNQTVQTI